MFNFAYTQRSSSRLYSCTLYTAKPAKLSIRLHALASRCSLSIKNFATFCTAFSSSIGAKPPVPWLHAVLKSWPFSAPIVIHTLHRGHFFCRRPVPLFPSAATVARFRYPAKNTHLLGSRCRRSTAARRSLFINKLGVVARCLVHVLVSRRAATVCFCTRRGSMCSLAFAYRDFSISGKPYAKVYHVEVGRDVCIFAEAGTVCVDICIELAFLFSIRLHAILCKKWLDFALLLEQLLNQSLRRFIESRHLKLIKEPYLKSCALHSSRTH